LRILTHIIAEEINSAALFN